MRIHTCAAEGCQHAIPRWLLMCPDHWRMVPAATQRAVKVAYAELKGPHQAQAFLAVRRSYLQACADAVSAVAAKQLARVERTERSTPGIFSWDMAPPLDQQLQEKEHGNSTEPGRRPAP